MYSVFLIGQMAWSRSTRSPPTRQNRRHPLSRYNGGWEEDFSLCDADRQKPILGYVGAHLNQSAVPLNVEHPRPHKANGDEWEFNEDKLGSGRCNVWGLHTVSEGGIWCVHLSLIKGLT